MEDYLNLSSLYYDISKPIGTSLDGDLEFYGRHIKGLNKVLEAGVGTGRLLIPYLKEGINIDGIDLSAEMLKICQEKAELHKVETSLIQGSVVDYDFDENYDAIIIPTGTIALFPEIKTVLSNFYKSLNDDGFVLFDLNIPSDFKLNEIFTYTLDVDQGTKLILEDKHMSIDWVNQKTSQLLTYHLWKSGKLVESELQTFTLNWYGLEEMKYTLKEVGFKNLEVYSNYTDQDVSADTHTLSIKAFK